jgi:hypothetical protein
MVCALFDRTARPQALLVGPPGTAPQLSGPKARIPDGARDAESNEANSLRWEPEKSGGRPFPEVRHRKPSPKSLTNVAIFGETSALVLHGRPQWFVDLRKNALQAGEPLTRTTLISSQPSAPSLFD